MARLAFAALALDAFGRSAIAALMSSSALAPASAASWLEKTFYMSGANYDGVLPPCEAALDKIATRFSQKESRFWNSDLQILGFERVRETAYSPWALGTIPRRFCRAVAMSATAASTGCTTGSARTPA